MARWRLTADGVYFHAIQYGQATEWQREEINTDTGRAFRKTYKVPMLIKFDDPYCINKHLGYVSLATLGSEQPGDIIITDFKPVPEMEPLDDEARQISEAERPNWINPIDGLAANVGEDFANQLLNALQMQANSLKSMPSGVAQPASSEVSNLSALVAAQQRQINELISALSGRSAATPERSDTIAATVIPSDTPTYDPSLHVHDDLEPLPTNEQIEAAQRAAAGTAKPTIKLDHPIRRV